MLTSKSYYLPLPTGLYYSRAPKFRSFRRPFETSLLKETPPCTTSFSVASYASQHPRPLNSHPWRCSSTHSARARPNDYTKISSCTSTHHLLRPPTTIQRTWPARRPALKFRPCHFSSKKHQHQYHNGARYGSYQADSFTLFYRSTQLAFLGTFLAIYLVLHDERQHSRFGSQLQKRQPTESSTLESIQQHLTSVRQSVQKHLTFQNLTYRPSSWPPETLAQCIPYVGHIFAHESATHLAMNSISFYFLSSVLFPTMGIFKTATTFVAGGILASQFECAAAKAYANPWNPWHKVVGALHVSPHDPNPIGTLGSGRLGASAGICAMFTVMAIAHPLARGRIFLIPSSIPIWMLWGGEVAWEGYSFYNNVDDGIGHGGHLAGHLAGALLWLVVLRWTMYGRWRRGVRWAELW